MLVANIEDVIRKFILKVMLSKKEGIMSEVINVVQLVQYN